MAVFRSRLRASFGCQVLLAVPIILSMPTCGLSEGFEGVNVSVMLENAQVSLHEPVVVHLDIRNDLPGKVTVDLGHDREGDLSFSIAQPDGTSVKPPQIAMREGLSRTPWVAVGPSETYGQTLVLNQWFPFSKRGHYRIMVTLETEIRSDSRPPTKAEYSRELDLDVTGRDEARLKKVCDGLAQAAMQKNAETALDAARSLSYVEDTVAVPYLAGLTRQGPFVVVTKTMGLQGLVRIARLDGADAVVSRLGPYDVHLEAEIRAALGAPSGEDR